YIARLNSDGSADTTFDANANNYVYSLAVQSDGKILAGGGFTTIGGKARNRIARLNSDGSADTTFDAGAVDIEVSSLAVQSDGKILAGGGFTTIGGQARNYIARLNSDGIADTTFNAGANNYVNSLAVQSDGKILAGGYFTTIGGQARNYIARLTNTGAAFQDISASVDGSTITWMRSGVGPEINRVTFEISTGLSLWAPLGVGNRITGGWQITGLSIPKNVNRYIRARGYVIGGYCSGSTSIIESVKNIYIINTAPAADSQSVTTAEDTAKDIILTGSDADGDPLTYTIVTGPTHGALSGTAPNVIYTPNANYHGADSFTFKVNDGTIDSNIATISITVTEVNNAPTANNQSVTTNEDTAKSIALTGSDIDGDLITYIIVSNPTHGVLSGTAPNVTYTPNADYFGTDSFTFKTNDGIVDSNIATVSITINVVDVTTPVLKGNIDTTSPGSANLVDGHDLYVFSKAFGSSPASPNWNSAADLNNSGTVDGEDLTILGANFGKSQ
ncbi:MAG: Ig-like domain-containing protein, partial [bacterium]|nr:Ig-like domain-containing protein [bacterium]